MGEIMNRSVMSITMLMLLIGCDQNTEKAEAEKKATNIALAQYRTAIDECKNDVKSGRIKTHKSYSECQKNKALPYLLSLNLGADMFIRLADYDIMLAEKVDKGKLTSSEAQVAYNEYLARIREEIDRDASRRQQQAFIDRQEQMERRSALMEAGASLMQSPAPSPIINCNTHYGANSSSTTCQ